MPNARTANAVRLEFAPGSLVQSNLSGAAFTGDWLWVAGDEACGLDRLSLLDPVGREALRFGAARDFPLADLLDLPGTAGEEADLEGMAVVDDLPLAMMPAFILSTSEGTSRSSLMLPMAGMISRPISPR